MPAILTLSLHGPTDHISPFAHINGLRALVLRWLAAADAELATAIHDDSGVNPYTIGPLLPAAEGRWTCRIALLTDGLLPYLLAGVESRGIQLLLGKMPFTLCTEETVLEGLEWEELLTPLAQPTAHWQVNLLTPTAHHRTGAQRHVLLTPEPHAYFSGWLRRWNRWSPFPLDETLLELVDEHVVVSEFNGQTRRIAIERPFIGFVGAVTLHWPRPTPLDHDARAALTLLARWSSLCGTGVDTARGMGQTRYVAAS